MVCYLMMSFLLFVAFSCSSVLAQRPNIQQPPPSCSCQKSFSSNGTKVSYTFEFPASAGVSGDAHTAALVSELQQKVWDQSSLLESQSVLIMQQKQTFSQRLNQQKVQIENLVAKVQQTELKMQQLESANPQVPDDCGDLVVSGNTPISDSQITVSSVSGNSPEYASTRSRIYSVKTDTLYGGWCANSNDLTQWLQYDFGRFRRVTAILTKGVDTRPFFVLKFQLYYGNSTLLMKPYRNSKGEVETFQGNVDLDTVKENVLAPPIYTRYLRINPTYWQGHICMRADVRGC
ncbi:coagulation factor VIII-like [Lingula anatina]|uniref:Coagulation factor VIII-like n=1 Tax=Lingula anatina TaxID=7574 RepID=A0A1S3JCT5_LINAN|nr:coagulation factor VIII-like [Lingula anatina]|eukprot:XP_013408225.1 coagulation factor VIII-like [Lingula anatina]